MTGLSNIFQPLLDLMSFTIGAIFLAIALVMVTFVIQRFGKKNQSRPSPRIPANEGQASQPPPAVIPAQNHLQLMLTFPTEVQLLIVRMMGGTLKQSVLLGLTCRFTLKSMFDTVTALRITEKVDHAYTI